MTWLVFARVVHYPFVNYDDPAYTYENSEVMAGPTAHGIVWAFTHVHSGNWHPLTTISHMIDARLFGSKPGGRHCVNLLLHTTSVIALFLLLRLTTGAVWRSAFVAAIFAIHPLRVESVAWIAERKDVLSGLFFMLTLAAYVHYARRPSPIRYLSMSILFAGGLMAKPMLVTLPFVLLLLDYWPLARSTSAKLIVEKIPLFALSCASAAATVMAQHGSISSLDRLPFSERLVNALVSYGIYLRQTFWPNDLAVIYPLRENQFAFWQVVSAALFLVAVTVAAWRLRSRRRYLLVGWLWYLSILVPVIGIVQVGLQSHADRYTYLSQIGLVIALTWSVVDLTQALRYQKALLAVGAIGALGALISISCAQLSYWRDSETLWNHTIAVTAENDVAHAHLADLLMRSGRIAESISHSQEAVRIRPGNADAQNNLGLALLQSGDEADAARHFEESLRVDAENLNAQVNLAWILATSSDPALRDGARAVELTENVVRGPGHDNPIVLRTLAAAYAEAGRFSEAIETAQRALTLAEGQGQEGLVVDLTRAISSFRDGQPVRSR